MENYEPVMSFDEEVAERYDDHPRGDELETVAFLEQLAEGGPARRLTPRERGKKGPGG